MDTITQTKLTSHSSSKCKDCVEPDIIIQAFNREYFTHKVFIMRSPFLRALIHWNDSETSFDYSCDSHEINSKSLRLPLLIFSRRNNQMKRLAKKIEYLTLSFDDDPFITQCGFEFCMNKLCYIQLKMPHNNIIIQVIATANYLGLEVVVAELCQYLKDTMTVTTATLVTAFLNERDIGKFGKELMEHSLFYLLKNGWENGADEWTDIPIDVITKIVGKDWFYVPNEYERAKFIIQIIKYKEIKGNLDEVKKMIEVLNNEVVYEHIPFNQLLTLTELYSTDSIMHPFIYTNTVIKAICKSAWLRSMVLSSYYEPKLSHKFCNSLSRSYITSYTDIISSLLETNDLSIPQKYKMYSKPIEFNRTMIPPIRISFCFHNLFELKYSSVIYSRLFFYGGSH